MGGLSEAEGWWSQYEMDRLQLSDSPITRWLAATLFLAICFYSIFLQCDV